MKLMVYLSNDLLEKTLIRMLTIKELQELILAIEGIADFSQQAIDAY